MAAAIVGECPLLLKLFTTECHRVILADCFYACHIVVYTVTSIHLVDNCFKDMKNFTIIFSTVAIPMGWILGILSL